MKAPVSLVIIVKNDPAIVNCIASLRPYVEEIVVVDGGSTPENQELVKGLVDIFEVYTEGNDTKTGLIEDFSKQRNKAFSLATKRFVLWADSDDIITGGEHLHKICEQYHDPACIMFPYEYGYDANGKCVLRHYRERLFLSKECFQWQSPVHETCQPKPGIKVISNSREELVWKHQRQYNPRGIESGRNLRILKKHVEKTGETDPRSLFYLAQEYKDGGYPDDAVKYYSKYLDISQWTEEKLMACLRLAEIEANRANYDKSLGWALKAIQTKSDWSEGYFAAGKAFYFLEKWKECVDFIKLGFSYSETKTSLFINPIERVFDIHRYFNFALNKIGKVSEALDSCNTALSYKADNDLESNRRLYQDFLVPPVYQKKNLTKKKLDIVFAIGDGMELWTPETIKNTGIGGSETMAASMAKGLAALGHNVSVYNSCAFKSIYDNVYYYPTEMLDNIECDVLIASRQAAFLDRNIQAKLKLLWCHDVILVGVTDARLRKADKILALTQWHKNNLINTHHVADDKVIVTRNGIDLKRFSKEIERVKYKCINSSSPDRGLPFLLDMWSDIKAAVPEATLELYYGFNNWIKSLEVNPAMRPIIEKIQGQIKELEPLGVTYHGRVNPQELAEAFLSSDCWLHPSNFHETSCITAMEAQAAGCRMITCPVAALKETAGERAVMVDPGNLPWDAFLSAPHAEFKKRYVEAVVETLNKPDGDDRLALQEYAREHFDLDKLCQEWNDLFYSL